MADEDTQNVTVEEKANEEIEPLDEPSQDEDLDALLIEDKDEDQIDPDIVIGEKDDLLGGGIDSEEQFEVLDSVGDTASEEKKNDQNEAKDTEKQDKEVTKDRPISPIVFGSKEPGKSGGETSKKAETMEHKITDKLFSHTRYFVMKSNNYDNIDIAKSKNVWSTPPLNEKKLDKAFQSCKNVLLIFSVKESGKFQGIAKLVSGARKDVSPPRWVLPPGISSSSMSVFKLDWIHRGEVAFLHTLHLKNPWNENKPVKISRDGQEVEPGVGEELCRLWIEHAEKPTASSQRTAPLPRKQNRPQDGGGSHGIHRHGLPMAAVPIIPAVQYQQYLQHHSMMKGPHSFGIGSVPHFNPLQSGALSTSRLREERLGEQRLREERMREEMLREGRNQPARKRSPSPKTSRNYRDRSPRYSRHRHDNRRHKERDRRGHRHDKR
jgi:hypothetical protein